MEHEHGHESTAARVNSFRVGYDDLPVEYIERIDVKEGVVCDTYKFSDDETRDLAIVRVEPGSSTPLQRILGGSQTTEGYLTGVGTLRVTSPDGDVTEHRFRNELFTEPISVEVGHLMQWTADPGSELTFFEICEPPYEDGRFENLAEE